MLMTHVRFGLGPVEIVKVRSLVHQGDVSEDFWHHWQPFPQTIVHKRFAFQDGREWKELLVARLAPCCKALL